MEFRRFRIGLAGLAVVMAIGTPQAGTGGPAPLSAQVGQVDEETVSAETVPGDPTTLLQELSRDYGFHSITCVVLESGQPPRYFVRGGISAVEAPRLEVDLGGISELFYALGLLRMETTGDFRLADRVDLALPSLAPENPWQASHPLRFEHLLQHCTGLAELPAEVLAGNPAVPASARDLLEVYRTAYRCLWPPDTYAGRTASNTLLLAAAAEELTGTKLGTWLKDSVFGPLGLQSVGLRPEVAAGTSAAAIDVRSAVWPVFGWKASLEDLAEVVAFLMARGADGREPFLPAEAFSRLEAPSAGESTRQGLQVGFGLGCRRIAENGWVWMAQDGLLPDSYVGFRYLPDQRRGMLLAGDGGAVHSPVELWASLEDWLTQDLEFPAPLVSDIPPRRLTALQGYYLPFSDPWPWARLLRFIQGPAYLTVDPRRLIFSDRGRDVSLFPVTDRRFRSEGEPLPTTVVLPGSAGRVELLSHSEYLPGNFRRISAVHVWLIRFLLFVAAVFLAAWLAGLLGRACGRAKGYSAQPWTVLVDVGLGASAVGGLCLYAGLVFAPPLGSWAFIEAAGRDSAFSWGLYAGSLLLGLGAILGLAASLLSWSFHRARGWSGIALAASLVVFVVWILLLLTTGWPIRTWS